MGDLIRLLNADNNRDIVENPITPAHLGGMIKLINDGTISGKIAKTLIDEMYATGKDPAALVEELGLKPTVTWAPCRPSSTRSLPTTPRSSPISRRKVWFKTRVSGRSGDERCARQSRSQRCQPSYRRETKQQLSFPGFPSPTAWERGQGERALSSEPRPVCRWSVAP